MALGDYEGVLCHACIGGTSVRMDIQALDGDKKPHIVVGTPGRVFDMINRGFLSMCRSFFKSVVALALVTHVTMLKSSVNYFVKVVPLLPV